jgi:hypothetical protein
VIATLLLAAAVGRRWDLRRLDDGRDEWWLSRVEARRAVAERERDH